MPYRPIIYLYVSVFDTYHIMQASLLVADTRSSNTSDVTIQAAKYRTRRRR